MPLLLNNANFEELAEASSKRKAFVIVAQDDTGDFTTIQEAIDEIRFGGGNFGSGTVYIKGGTYEITTSLIVNAAFRSLDISIIGEGADRVKITSNENSGAVLTLDSTEGVTIKNLQITGTGTAQIGIKDLLQFNKKLTIENVKFRTQTGVSLGFSGLREIKINGCYFDCDTKGIYVEDIDKLIITNNFFDGDGYGIHIFDSFDTTISNNHIYTSAGGFDGILIEETSPTTITGNIVDNSGAAGIHIKGNTGGSGNRVRQGTVGNNVITNTTGNGITIGVNVEDITINGNVINDAGADAIELTGATGADTTDRILIVGNLIDTPADDGVDVNTNCTRVIIHSNLIRAAGGSSVEDNGTNTSDVNNIKY